MATMHVNLVSLEEQIFSGEAEYVVAPGCEGELGIYPHHISLINKLVPGLFRVKLPQKEMQLVYAISGGFLEVQGNHVTVLADVVERTDDLDEVRLLEQKRVAEEVVRGFGSAMNTDTAKAYASLELVLAQLKALDFMKKQSRRS